jgi:hypothetical protein
MNLVRFKSQPKISPIAPEWNYFLFETIIDGVDWQKVAEIVLRKEKEIVEQFPFSTKGGSADAYTGLGPNSLTSRYEDFNVFEWQEPEIRKVFHAIRYYHDILISKIGIEKIPDLYVQCWANVMRKGQKIEKHIHDISPYTYLGGHITVQCENTKTIYVNPINQINDWDEHKSENKVGKLTLFQNNIPHYTSMHEGEKERISIAFDIVIGKEGFKSPLVPLYD